ncbi:GNAT family N-acetyltransferase [Nisaea acidiphila]|uniref:GNAT family N-acetyltransferase n=1 Tax=Nisaea acidiphila TaxID=1862145 RepID=A0A9J7ARD9_9PROT|nr:GNAT family N-acetyltransferase [Nisaea acidiphila]UUX49145.1 GNAT family N-acetyltransferase [Nisaea acidiphila]
MDFAIRALQESDAERVAEMAAELSAHEGMPPPPFGPDDVLKYGFGLSKRFDGIVAESGSDLIGYTLFIDSFNVGLGTPGIHMLDLFVENRARGSGAGRALIAAVAAETIAREGAWLVWQCLPANKTAINFYHHIGSRQYQAADFELSSERLTDLAAASSWR